MVAAESPKSPPAICLCACATSAVEAGPRWYCFGGGRNGAPGGGCPAPAGGGWAVPAADPDPGDPADPAEPDDPVAVSGNEGGGDRSDPQAVSNVASATTAKVVRVCIS